MNKVFFILIVIMIWSVPNNNSIANDSDHYPNDFKLVQQNVFLMPTYITSWGQTERAKFIGEAEYMKGHDAVILNELYDNQTSETLLSKLKEEYPFHTPVLGRSKNDWDETLGYYSNYVPEDGGVSIMSRWPIIEKIQYVYKNGCGIDYYSNKGFIYVKIQKNDAYYHIIGTHAQANYTGCGNGEEESVRSTQFQELRNFVIQKNIPDDEIVFIGGDFNVNKNNDEEYAAMLEKLNVTSPEYRGHSSTWDPETNSILAKEHPDKDPHYLDYIFVEKDHAQPSFWINEIMNDKSPDWKAIINTYNDYSDHYSVAGYSE
ncbi:sphingomyelin phosphodiesterase [Chengkuizengella marina]|uniref:Sphingomyelin phosphodiesterase n=1 Tax=Chengkuizengella marina TaxID=2507566 RepID=A0A6N9Q5S0_9BACL|nr:sphingomyelin phosphodiesterase [Chengkuizengella marina]NBI30186.1 sphingomyelin phosphodiesterase [Chengkuizengella marina]